VLTVAVCRVLDCPPGDLLQHVDEDEDDRGAEG
jgi:DNA-binding Xre family transcriptional regulator